MSRKAVTFQQLGGAALALLGQGAPGCPVPQGMSQLGAVPVAASAWCQSPAGISRKASLREPAPLLARFGVTRGQTPRRHREPCAGVGSPAPRG